MACWTVAWEVGKEAVRESPLSWSWSCGAEIMGLAGVNGFSCRGPCPFPFPRWRGKHEQWDCEIHKGSDWLPSQGEIEIHERTYAHISEYYGRCHFLERREATRLMAALASTATMPLQENTSGLK